MNYYDVRQKSLTFSEQFVISLKRGFRDRLKARQAGGRPLTDLTVSLTTIQPFASDEVLRKSCLVQEKQQKFL